MSESAALKSLTPVLVQGPDARKFMQGQLTNDVRKLTRERALLGSCNTGQGRVQAVLTLLERNEGVVALFPTATLERLLTKLRASIFSTKVSFELLPWSATPISAAEASARFVSLPREQGQCVSEGELTLLRWWSADERYLLLGAHAPSQASTVQDEEWRAADLAAGLPQVYAETQTSFVPQMLNLDLLHGISFDKGCYVGQEIVARARRNGVPRRMFRFSARCAPAAPGTPVLHGSDEVGELVDAVSSRVGCELLAVVNLDKVSAPLALRGVERSELTLATLPYDVPLERR
ncbi:MAG TPA: hypothetical protein VI299_18650 [Polyangiales bacterium]